MVNKGNINQNRPPPSCKIYIDISPLVTLPAYFLYISRLIRKILATFAKFAKISPSQNKGQKPHV